MCGRYRRTTKEVELARIYKIPIPPQATDEWLRTCTIVTGDPNELVAQMHTPMPVIRREEYKSGCQRGATSSISYE
jgi:putative SOS response-associated peptidase YedK